MRNKIICLALSVLTVISVLLAGCGSSSQAETTTEQTSTRTPVSLNFYIITNEETTPEAEAAVEEAFNEITKSRFTTYVDLIFCTEDEYNNILEEKFKQIEDKIAYDASEKKRLKEEAASLKAAGITTVGTTTVATESEVTKEETVLNEYGFSELKYPAISDYQMDIILIKGYDMLTGYADADRLSMLDELLSSTSKKLYDYIYPSFFSATEINGITYAIPNNHVIGEYTFLLINKDLAAKYYIDTDKIKTLSDCEEFLTDVSENEPTYVPMLAPVDAPTIHYWSDDGSPSLLASYVSATATLGTRLIIKDPFSVKQFTSHELLMMKFKENGYFSSDPENEENFAVSVVKGSAALADKYTDEYVVKVLEYPTATEEILYESFFGVTAYTKNLNRAMEIITLLDTDTELRNILQYGVEGVNYEIDDDGYLVRLNHDYMMNLVDTGNVYMAYPEEGMPLDVWDYGKKQNLDSVTSPVAGLSAVWDQVDQSLMEQLKTLGEDYFTRMKACTTSSELEEFFAAAKAELAENEIMQSALDTEDNKTSPYSVYANEWYNVLWPPQA